MLDDGSSEDTECWVREKRLGVRVVHLYENRGLAAALNDGIRSLEGGAIMLLTSEITLAPDCIKRLVDGLKSTGADAATPLLVAKDGPETVYSAGAAQRVDGRPERIGFREPRAGFVPPVRRSIAPDCSRRSAFSMRSSLRISRTAT